MVKLPHRLFIAIAHQLALASVIPNASLIWAQQAPGPVPSVAIALHSGVPPTFAAATVFDSKVIVEVYDTLVPNGTARWMWSNQVAANSFFNVVMARRSYRAVDTVVYGGSQTTACLLVAWSSLGSGSSPAWTVSDSEACTPLGAAISDDGSTVAYTVALGPDFTTSTPLLRVFDAQTGAARLIINGSAAPNGYGVAVSSNGSLIAAVVAGQSFCAVAVYDAATGALRGPPIQSCPHANPSGKPSFALSASGDTLLLNNVLYAWSEPAGTYALTHVIHVPGSTLAVALTDGGSVVPGGLVGVYSTLFTNGFLNATLTLASASNGSSLGVYNMGQVSGTLKSPHVGLAADGDLCGVVGPLGSAGIPMPSWPSTLSVVRAGSPDIAFSFSLGTGLVQVFGAALAVDAATGDAYVSASGLNFSTWTGSGPSGVFTWRLAGSGAD